MITQSGRLQTIVQLTTGRHPSLSVGSKETRFADVNLDVNKTSRPDVVASVLNLPFASGVFREVFFTDVIEHIPKGTEMKALAELHRVLISGGQLVLSTPNKTLLYRLMDPAYFLIGHRHYSSIEVRLLLEKAGFKSRRLFSAGGTYALLCTLWYCLITFPVKKFLREVTLPDVPRFMSEKENAEYARPRLEGGYSIFAVAVA